MDPQGQLVANWYVFCDLCTNRHQLEPPRTISATVAARRLRELGWSSKGQWIMGDRVQRWTCPTCNAARKRFFEREKAIRQRKQSKA